MTKTYRSDKTGKDYTFTDDWADDEAWKEIDKMEAPKSAADASFGEVLSDVGTIAKQAGYAVSSAAVGLADIAGNVLVPGSNIAGRLESVGIAPTAMHEQTRKEYSPGMQAEIDALDAADGVGGTLKALAENPNALLPILTDSAALMTGGVPIARALPKNMGWAKKAGIAEGTVAGGSASEGIRETGEAMEPGQTAIAIASGAGTGALGFLGAKLAQRWGINDIDTVMASGEFQATSKNFLRRMAEGGVAEGIFEELPQSMQEQMWQNFATDRPLMEGVAKAGTLGAVAGGLMGGATGMVSGGKSPESTINTSRELPPIQEADPSIPAPEPRQPVEAAPLTDADEEFEARMAEIAAVDKMLDELGLGEKVADVATEAPDPVILAVNPQVVGLSERQISDTGLTREVLRDPNNFSDKNTSVPRDQRRVLRAMGGSPIIGSRFSEQPLAALDTTQGPIVMQVGEDTLVRPGHYMKGVMEDIYRLAKEFNPGGIYVILPEDTKPVGSKNHAAGGYSYHNGIHYIIPRHMTNLNKEGSHKTKEGENEYSTYAKAQAWSTLDHEFGHSVITSFMTNGLSKEEATLFEQGAASGKIDEAVIARLNPKAAEAVRAWEELRQKIMTKQISGKQAALMWLSPTKLMSKSTMEESYGKGMGVFTPEALARKGMLDYQLNFHEFAAEQMAKMLYARGEMKVSKTLAAVFKNYDPEGLTTWVDERVAAFLEPLLDLMKGLYFKIAGKEVTGDELQQIGVDAIPEMKEWFALLAENARQQGLAKTKEKEIGNKATQSTEVEDLPVDWNSRTMQNKARATLRRLVREGAIHRNSKRHREISGMLNRHDYDAFLEAIEPNYKTAGDLNGIFRNDLTSDLLDNMDRPGIRGKVEQWAAKYIRELGGKEVVGGVAVVDRPGRKFGPFENYVTVGTKVGNFSYMYAMTPEGYQNYLANGNIENFQAGSVGELVNIADYSILEFMYAHEQNGGISITAFPRKLGIPEEFQTLVKRDKGGMLQIQGTTWNQRLELFGEMLARVRMSDVDAPYNTLVTWKRASGALLGKEGVALFALDTSKDKLVGYGVLQDFGYVITASPLDAEMLGGENSNGPMLVGVELKNPVLVDGSNLVDLSTVTEEGYAIWAQQNGYDGALVVGLPGSRGNIAIAYNASALYEPENTPDLGARMRFDLTNPEGSEAAGKWSQLKSFGADKLADGVYKLYNAQWIGLQLQQLAHMNPQWLWFKEYDEDLRKYYRKAGGMQAPADAVLKQIEWMGKENQVKMGKFTRAEARGGEHWTDMTVDQHLRWTHKPNAQTYEKLKEFGIDPDSTAGKHFLSLYIEAKNANQFQMDSLERVMFSLINRKYADPTMHLQREQKVKELRMTFMVRRKSPFWANDAFGQFHIVAKNAKGEKIYETATDSLRESQRLKTAAEQKYGKDKVTSFEESYEQSLLMRLPVEFIDEASIVLGLDMNNPNDRAKRNALAELMGSLYSKTPDQIYDPNKMLVEGGSTDFQKTFSSFAIKNANFIAKMEYRKYLQNSISKAKNEAKDQELVAEQEKINRAVEFMERTVDYALNPQEELAFIRGTVAVAYLMYNAGVAAFNLVGLMNTWAVLNRELGYLKGTTTFAKTTAAAGRTLGWEAGTSFYSVITRAAQRANNSITDPNWEMVNGQPTEIRRALKQAKDENILDQTYAYYLAGQAMKGNLSRMASVSIPGKAFKGFIDTGMSAFRATELFTRRASFLAAYEIQQQVYPDKTEKQRYEEATRVIGLMQGDYTKGNKPVLFRGQIMGFLTIFMTFVQNQTWAVLGGMDKGLKRQDAIEGRVSPKFYRSYSMQMLLMLLFLAGPEGLPFGENIMDLIDILYKKLYGKSARTAIREFLVEMEADPMLWTRGLAYNFMGFDVSKKIGIGRILPATDRIGQEYDNSNTSLGTMAFSAAGVGGSYVKWLMDTTQLTTNTIRAGMPLSGILETQLPKLPGGPGSIFTAAKWTMLDARGPAGGLLAWDDDTNRARSIHPWEIVGRGMGLQPQSVAKGQAMRMDQYENTAYWRHYKQFIYDAWWQASEIAKDREAIADVRVAIDKYNKSIPHPDLWITETMLRESIARRKKGMELANTMTPIQKMMRGVAEQSKDTF